MKTRLALVVASFIGLGAVFSGPEHTVSREFSLEGIDTVVFRAGNADATEVKVAERTSLLVQGVPSGSAFGYHSADPNWKETPADKWGFDFVAQKHGATLVISTTREIDHIHHYYALHSLKIEAPARIKVLCEKRKLSLDEKPDLSEPKKP